MSNENLNREDIKDRREEIFTELGSNLTTAHSELNDLKKSLQEYHEILEEIEARYSNLPQDKQRGFASSLGNIADTAVEADSPREVLDTREDLEAAFENPLIRSVQQRYFSLYHDLGITIDDPLRRELEGKIQATAESAPEDALQKTEELLEKVDDLADPVNSAFKSYIEDDLRNVTDPNELLSAIENLNSRYQSLKSLSRTLNEYAWAPSELENIHTWEELVAQGTDIDCIELIENIEDHTISIPDIVPVQSVIANEIQERSRELRSQPASVFEDIESDLETISKYKKELAEIEALSQVIDFESGSEDFMDIVSKWERKPPHRLSALVESVESVARHVNAWRAEVNERWQEKQQIVSAYADIIETDPPEIVIEYIDTELPTSTDLAHSYDVIIKTESWITEHEDEILEYLSPEARELFHRLSENQPYDICEEELDPLAELLDFVDIRVVIDE